MIRFLLLASGLLFLASPSLYSQPDPNSQESRIVTVSGVKYHCWYGHAGRSYFIQVSDPNSPLVKWNWLPAIEAGNDEEISHIIGGTAAQVFYRLKYTDQVPGPNETLDTADFDLDGIPNFSEIVPTLPLLPKDATDPLDPDSDDDGMNDGYERDNGLDPNDPGTGDPDNGPNGDPDQDGLTNAEELALGTDPKNPHSDGDVLKDGEDAVPLDGEINWKKTPESKYIWIEQMVLPTDDNSQPIVPIAVNSGGLILFPRYTAGQFNPTNDTRAQALWDSATHAWLILAPSGSQNIELNQAVTLAVTDPVTVFKDINDAGTVSALGMGNITAPAPYATSIEIQSGMIWKRVDSSPLMYSAPRYYVHHREHVHDPGNQEIQCRSTFGTGNIVMNSRGDIGTDDSVNLATSFTPASANSSSEYDHDWMIYDGATKPSILNLQVRSLTVGYDQDESYPGAILDKNRALFVETNNVTNVSRLWLKDSTTVQEIANADPHGHDDTDITLAPSENENEPDRLWITSGIKVLLEKHAGGTGAARWHHLSDNSNSMAEGAIRLNTRGEAITRGQMDSNGAPVIPPKVWRNGKYTNLNQVASKPSTVTITEAIDLASNGIILAQATDGEVKKTGLLVPIDITVVFGIGPSAPAVNGVPGTSRHFLESYLESVKVSRVGDIWLVKGKDAAGADKLYCIEVATTEDKLLTALGTAGMTVVFDGHANFGLGPNFSMSTLKNIDDFTNFGARSHAAIPQDFRGNGQEPDAIPYIGPNALPLPSNPQTPEEFALIASWGNLHQEGWAYLVPAAQDGIMGDVENYSVPFMNLWRYDNDQNKGPGDTFAKQGQGFNNEWHFTRTSEEVTDTYLIVKAPNTDVPTLRYSTFFYNACSTGVHFIENFQHGKFIYTKRTCTIDRGSSSFVKSLVRGKTPEEATAILDGEDNVDNDSDFETYGIKPF